jgi:hypothetical protein
MFKNNAVSMTEDSTPLPGTVFTPRGFRILKIAVAVMTVLMLAGIAALVYGVTLQLSKLGSGSKPEVAAETATVPAGAVPYSRPLDQGDAGRDPARAQVPAPYTRTLDLGPGKLEAITAGTGLIVLYWKGEASDIVISADPRTGNELGRIQIPHH